MDDFDDDGPEPVELLDLDPRTLDVAEVDDPPGDPLLEALAETTDPDVVRVLCYALVDGYSHDPARVFDDPHANRLDLADISSAATPAEAITAAEDLIR